jgi:HlyD family secretion protein
MLKKWQLVLIITATVLFLSINIFLIKKENSKVDKVEYLESWMPINTGELVKFINKPGVAVSSEESHVYFDENKGAFNELFVKEGDEVTRGTPLFDYSPQDIEMEIKILESQLEETEDKISSLEDHISDLIDYRADIRKDMDDEEADEEGTTSRSSYHDLERDIYNKELEKEWLEDEADRIENQIDDLEDNEDFLTVKSNVEGTVKKLSKDLSNPLITISSSSLAISGSFREAEMKDVSEGLKSTVSAHNIPEVISGTVTEISGLPAEEPAVEKESVYPFKVELETAVEGLLPGTHVAVKIITDEVTGATIAPQGAIFKKKKKEFINILTASGTVERREIATGLKLNGKAEIKTGVEKGELALIHKKPQSLEDGSEFITPIKIDRLTDIKFKEQAKKNWRYLLKGILAR